MGLFCYEIVKMKKDFSVVALFFVVILALISVLYSISVKLETFSESIKIMQTHRYDVNDIPANFKKAMMSWKTLKNTTHHYYNNKQAEEYLLKNFDEKHAKAFRDINIGAFKSDFFRYCWVYKEGGIYADMDSVCLTDISTWLKKNSDIDIVLTRDDPSNSMAFYQAFIYCKKPGNPLMRECINMILDNIEAYRKGSKFNAFALTGPGLVYMAFIKLNPQYTGKVPPAGIINTSHGKMMVMTWSGDNLIDNRGTNIVKHKCDGCDDDNYWYKQLDEKKWVT
jgi:hypothetical protein